MGQRRNWEGEIGGRGEVERLVEERGGEWGKEIREGKREEKDVDGKRRKRKDRKTRGTQIERDMGLPHWALTTYCLYQAQLETPCFPYLG